MLFQIAYAKITDQQLELAMRMVGHQILLASGDSTSRVLPIVKDSTHFTINFESEFSFVPDDLIPLIDCILDDAHVKNGYFVEVREKLSQQIVYVYEMGRMGILKSIPCLLRAQPKAHYSVHIYLVDLPTVDQSEELNLALSADERDGHYFRYLLILGIIMALLAYKWFFSYSKNESEEHLISIGNSQFDKFSKLLKTNSETTELSNKEAELLLLLDASANEAIGRNVILNKVWGDEGAYVGRTLDVYISKLRKKIVQDQSLKIENIRGVGYKLVVKNN